MRLTSELENDPRTVETSTLINVNFYSEIHSEKFVDSNLNKTKSNKLTQLCIHILWILHGGVFIAD